VLPDLLETMKRVLARSISFRRCGFAPGRSSRGCAGAENRRSAGRSARALRDRGWILPCRAGECRRMRRLVLHRRKLSILAAWESCSSVMPSHPSQLASSSPVQSEASPCQKPSYFSRGAPVVKVFFYGGVKIGGKGSICAFVCDVVVRLCSSRLRPAACRRRQRIASRRRRSACRSHLS